MLKDLPYNNIKIVLDNLKVDSRFFAAGKIYAKEQMPLNSIHIDLDVFFEKDNISELLEFKGYDLLTQNIASFKNKEANYLKVLAPSLMDKLNNPLLGCGVVGFSSQELKDKYIQEYKKSVLQLCKNYSLFKEVTDRYNLNWDLLVEETLLYHLSKEYKVKTIITNEITHDVAKSEYGFNHIVSKQKFNAENIAKVKQAVKELNEDVYIKLRKYDNLGLD